jgi:hypothetical protein
MKEKTGKDLRLRGEAELPARAEEEEESSYGERSSGLCREKLYFLDALERKEVELVSVIPQIPLSPILKQIRICCMISLNILPH